MNATGLVNAALTRLGERSITGLDQETSTARVALFFFHDIVDEVTTESDWSFSKHRVSAEPEEETPDTSDYLYAYTVPEDCLRVLSVSPDVQYEIEGIPTMLYCDVSEIVITYQRSLVEIDEETELPELRSSTLPPKFLQALSCRLASVIAVKIGGNPNIMADLRNEYYLLLRQTRGQDAQETPGKNDTTDWWWEA